MACALKLSSTVDLLRKIAFDENQSDTLRIEAFRTIASLQGVLSDHEFDILAGRFASTHEPLARISAIEILAMTKLTASQIQRLVTAIKDDTLVSPTTVWPMLNRSVDSKTIDAILGYAEHAMNSGGWLMQESELSRIAKTAREQRSDLVSRVQALSRKIAEQSRVQQATWAEYMPLLNGGNGARGRKLFFSNMWGARAAIKSAMRVNQSVRTSRRSL